MPYAAAHSIKHWVTVFFLLHLCLVFFVLPARAQHTLPVQCVRDGAQPQHKMRLQHISCERRSCFGVLRLLCCCGLLSSYAFRSTGSTQLGTGSIFLYVHCKHLYTQIQFKLCEQMRMRTIKTTHAKYLSGTQLKHFYFPYLCGVLPHSLVRSLAGWHLARMHDVKTTDRRRRRRRQRAHGIEKPSTSSVQH